MRGAVALPGYATVANLVNSYGNMECRMSMKVHLLDAHLDEFTENLGAYSDKHDEWFHQDIKDFESRYQGQYNENMMGENIWGLIWESDLEYTRKSRKATHFQLNCVQYFTQEPWSALRGYFDAEHYF